MNEKAEYLQLLWDEFTLKVSNDFEKYTTHGASLVEAKDKINFAKAVIDDMENHFISNDKRPKKINPLTLYNYLQKDSFPKAAKIKTLDIFSDYCGYFSWNDFKKQKKIAYKSAHSTLSTAENATNVMAFSPLRAKNNAKNLKWLMLPLIGLIFFCYMISSNPDQEKLASIIEFETLITQANAAEFEAYKSLPDIDTSTLFQYFSKSGTALHTIIGTLERKAESRAKLLIPPSSQVLLDVNVEERSGNKAIVQTHEHWVIRWYDSLLQKELLYDTLNTHRYFIDKVDGSWKITSDIYEGKVRVPATELVK